MQPDDVVAAGSRLLRRPLRFERVLTGGQHAVTVMVTNDEESQVVRAFPRSDPAVAHEVAALERVAPLGALVPHLIAYGEEAGHPIIVTSAVPGHHPDMSLSRHTIAREMGRALAAIHELSGASLPSESWLLPTGSDILSARSREVWKHLDWDTQVLTHFDFWCGNALWDKESLVGVVDWSGARSAPRGIDIAWCRQDLVLLGSPSAADEFVDSYQESSGHEVRDVRGWDVLAAAHANPNVETWDENYAGIGLPDVTSEVLRARLDAWVAQLLA